MSHTGAKLTPAGRLRNSRSSRPTVSWRLLSHYLNFRKRPSYEKEDPIHEGSHRHC